MRRGTGGPAVSANRRRSTSLASPTSAGTAGGEAFNSNGSLCIDRVRARLQVIKETLRRRMHETIDEQGGAGCQVTGRDGFQRLPRHPDQCGGTLSDFRHNVADLSALAATSAVGQKERRDVGADDRAGKSMAFHTACIAHPWPDKRFAVKHPRW